MEGETRKRKKKTTCLVVVVVVVVVVAVVEAVEAVEAVVVVVAIRVQKRTERAQERYSERACRVIEISQGKVSWLWWRATAQRFLDTSSRRPFLTEPGRKHCSVARRHGHFHGPSSIRLPEM